MSHTDALFDWRRGPRSSFRLGSDKGVYALFLKDGAGLAGIEPGKKGLLYIGLAAGSRGFAGRCHFDSRTRNHSPRKSLVILLMDRLALIPVHIAKPNGSGTWGLEPDSDRRLSAWMHEHLDVAFEPCSDPHERERVLISFHAPPLNLEGCHQSAHHLSLSAARKALSDRLRGDAVTTFRPCDSDRVSDPVDTAFDTAEAIAARYRLDPKSYRQRLRKSVAWYRKPQIWTFALDSAEHRDMISVAQRMRARSD